MNELSNQVCIVTGGGSGIGLAVTRRLLSHGARVAIAGRTAAKLDKAATELGGGERLATFAVDVSQASQVREFVAKVVERWGGVHVLVNNAGLNIKERTLRELTPESWDLLVQSNLNSAFYCIHAVLPVMRRQHDGLVVNISSTAGKRAGPISGAAYVAAKFGMQALGTCLGAEEKEAGIRVCNIFPGEVDTPILDKRPKALTAEQRSLMLQADDVARAVEFVVLLPPRASIPELIIKPSAATYI